MYTLAYIEIVKSFQWGAFDLSSTRSLDAEKELHQAAHFIFPENAHKPRMVEIPRLFVTDTRKVKGHISKSQ